MVLSVFAPLSWASFGLRHQHSSCCQGREDNRGFPAYVASAALQREHVGAYGIGIEESFAVRHSRGSSVPLIQYSSVQASVDIDP